MVQPILLCCDVLHACFHVKCEPFNTVRTRQTYRPALSHVHLTLRLGIDAPILGFIWLLINQTVTTHPLPELLGVPHRQFMNVRLTLKNVLPARGLKHTISKWQPRVFFNGDVVPRGRWPRRRPADLEPLKCHERWCIVGFVGQQNLRIQDP